MACGWRWRARPSADTRAAGLRVGQSRNRHLDGCKTKHGCEDASRRFSVHRRRGPLTPRYVDAGDPPPLLGPCVV